MPRRALIIGASSAIASAIARELAADAWELVLAGRDAGKLDALARDLRVRHSGTAEVEIIDVLDVSLVDGFFDRLAAQAKPCSLVVIAPGLVHSNADCLRDMHNFRRMAETNFTGVAHCAARAAEVLATAGGGEIMVISSISGDRGRPRNFFYGSTKAGLDAFLEGLRLSLSDARVNVINLKPGPVSNTMPAEGFRGKLHASPETVARIARNALGKGRHRVYAPGWWRFPMWLLRLLPGALLARLRI